MPYIIVFSILGAAIVAGLVAYFVVKSKKKRKAQRKVVLGSQPKHRNTQNTQTSEVKEPQSSTKSEETPQKSVVQKDEEKPSQEAPKNEAKPTQSSAKYVEADDEDDDSEEDSDEDTDGQTERKLVVENGEVKYIVIKYSKSFQAKLIQSDETTKGYYSQLKNYLLSYPHVKSRMSWKWETFRTGRKTLVKLRLRGKTLSVTLALDPNAYTDTKYIVESIADVAAYADTPCLYRIKNDRRLKYCKELIDVVMTENGLSAGLIEENVDYASQFPFETTEALVERKLIKVLTDEDASSGTVFKPSDVRKRVTAAEVDTLMQDEVAEILLEKGSGVSDKTKTGIINIDVLSRYFNDDETVNLEEIKKRVPDFNKKTTYLKVLARGTLDKRLTVEADNFSLQAVKMIVLTGGKAIRK